MLWLCLKAQQGNHTFSDPSYTYSPVPHSSNPITLNIIGATVLIGDPKRPYFIDFLQNCVSGTSALHQDQTVLDSDSDPTEKERENLIQNDNSDDEHSISNKRDGMGVPSDSGPAKRAAKLPKFDLKKVGEYELSEVSKRENNGMTSAYVWQLIVL